MNIKEEIEIKNKLLAMQLTWIETADKKVAPLFAINAAMLSLLIALAKGIPVWTIIAAIPSVIVAILLLLSIFFLALAMFPRLEGPKESNIFFGGIVKQAKDNYISKMLSIDGAEYQNDILNQVYRNAEIANSKYKYIKWAFIYTFVSTPPWLVAIYVLYI